MERDHPSDPPLAVVARHLARVPLPEDSWLEPRLGPARNGQRRCRQPRSRSFPTSALAGLLASAALVSAACSGNHHPVTPGPSTSPISRGTASWYGSKFDGRRTANGERYDMRKLTAAHPNLPFGTLVQVTNVENGRQVVVRINDRGPFGRRRVIDLSYAAARELRMVGPGTARVELAVIGKFDPMAPASPAQPIVLAAAPAPSRPDGASPVGPAADAGNTAPGADSAEIALTDAQAARAAVPSDSAGATAASIASVAQAPERAGPARVGAAGAIGTGGAQYHYTVQVGAFGEVERAEAMQQDLAGRYPEASVSSDGTWSRVQVGRFGDREEAEALRRELASIGLAAVVVAAR